MFLWLVCTDFPVPFLYSVCCTWRRSHGAAKVDCKEWK